LSAAHRAFSKLVIDDSMSAFVLIGLIGCAWR
jgi:hypothetical protein